MKLHYYSDTDSLYIEFSDKPGKTSTEIAEGVVMDLDSDGNIVGLDIEHASQKLDLTSRETIELPVRRIRSA